MYYIIILWQINVGRAIFACGPKLYNNYTYTTKSCWQPISGAIGDPPKNKHIKPSTTCIFIKRFGSVFSRLPSRRAQFASLREYRFSITKAWSPEEDDPMLRHIPIYKYKYILWCDNKQRVPRSALSLWIAVTPYRRRRLYKKQSNLMPFSVRFECGRMCARKKRKHNGNGDGCAIVRKHARENYWMMASWWDLYWREARVLYICPLLRWGLWLIGKDRQGGNKYILLMNAIISFITHEK